MKSSLRIAILIPSYENSSSPFRGHDPVCDPSRHLVGCHSWERIAIDKKTAVAQIRDLSRLNFDLFFNLCDGAFDEDRPGPEVVLALEKYNCAFTGATSSFYEPTREIMKKVCRYWGINTPEFVFANDEAGVKRALETLRFPMIVKHENSYGSIGMGKSARVTTAEELLKEVLQMSAYYGGALIEEFIEGREFTVLVTENDKDPSEPLTFTPVECQFPPGETFKHFDLKWVGYEGMHWVSVKDEKLDRQLREMAKLMFKGHNGTGYARCDMRMDQEGNLFMLEINPNCGIFYPEGHYGSADIILAQDRLGHSSFVTHQIEVALNRHKKNKCLWKIDYDRKQGHGMYANSKIPAGTLIQAFEEQSHHLVTRQHVEKTWSQQKKEWFSQYAWPLSENVFVMWSDDPSSWRPINHSCDPNTWVQGLDLVARLDIAAGEAITIDYATFCGESMQEFDCSCRSPLCRKIIRGSDSLLPFMERYGENISDYVKTRRQENAGKCIIAN